MGQNGTRGKAEGLNFSLIVENSAAIFRQIRGKWGKAKQFYKFFYNFCYMYARDIVRSGSGYTSCLVSSYASSKNFFVC